MSDIEDSTKDKPIKKKKAINVAKRNLMVEWSNWMGSAVNHGNSIGKVISISPSMVIVRPIHESRPHDMGKVQFRIPSLQYVTNQPWSTYHRLLSSSKQLLRDLYKELFGEDMPPGSWDDVPDDSKEYLLTTEKQKALPPAPEQKNEEDEDNDSEC